MTARRSENHTGRCAELGVEATHLNLKRKARLWGSRASSFPSHGETPQGVVNRTSSEANNAATGSGRSKIRRVRLDFALLEERAPIPEDRGS